MNEAEFERQMVRRLGGAMSETESRALEEALRSHPAWRRRFAAWQSVWQEAAGAEESEARETGAPLGLRARVVARAAADAADRSGLWAAWLAAPARQRAGSAATAACVLALGVALGMFLAPVERAATIALIEPAEAGSAAAIAVDPARPPAVGADSLGGSGFASQVAEVDFASEIGYLLGGSGEDDLEISGVGLGEAGLAALEELFEEANPS